MKIELKNVKHAAFASEETNCFEATVYVDDVKAGRAHNEGRGGMTWVEPAALRERIDAYGATLPDKQTDWLDPNDRSKMFTYAQTAETLIDDLLETWLAERDLKRLLKKLTIRVPSDPPGAFRTVSGAADDRARAFAAKQFPQATILNDLPFNEALRVYRGQL